MWCYGLERLAAVASATELPGAVVGVGLHAATKVGTTTATATTHVRSRALPDLGNCNTNLQRGVER